MTPTTTIGSRISARRPGHTHPDQPEYIARELRVVVGVIEPHQFVGFSGGVKSAAVGLGGYTTIGRNHSMMTHPLRASASTRTIRAGRTSRKSAIASACTSP